MSISRAIFDHVFDNKPYVFLAVVHTTNKAQAIHDTSVAHENGADGVFLINHAISSQSLFDVYEKVRTVYPNYWIGLNCLDLSTLNAVESAPQTINGLWSDCANVPDNGIGDERSTSAFEAFERRYKSSCALYFGGVAFKHQPQPTHLAQTTKLARGYMDVVTTSGYQTGKPPALTKIQTMNSNLRGHPFAIASGMTPENVREYMPYANCFLVNTGISDDEECLDPTLVRKFADVINN